MFTRTRGGICAPCCRPTRLLANTKTFETTTAGLLSLLAWLSRAGCTHVAMEATGVYWKPVWNILSDGDFELILANAAHIKNVPGRKTDVSDAAWITDLLASRPDTQQFCAGRGNTRTPRAVADAQAVAPQQTSHIQRLQKTLEEANMKLDSVITDIVGSFGRG